MWVMRNGRSAIRLEATKTDSVLLKSTVFEKNEKTKDFFVITDKTYY